MEIVLIPLIRVVLTLISLYSNIILAAIIVSWLRAFNVISTSNRFMYALCDVLDRLTEPVFAYARRFIPAFNGLDFSPIVVLIALEFLQTFLVRVAYRILM